MSRRSKYIKRILWGILLTPFILILLVAVLLYVPPVQRFVVQRTAAYLSEKTGMQVSVGNIHLAFPLDLSLQKLQVLRSPGDTLISVGALSLSPTLRPLFDSQVEVPRIALDSLTYNQRDSLGLSLLKYTSQQPLPSSSSLISTRSALTSIASRPRGATSATTRPTPRRSLRKRVSR